jgi:SAM-dependent MidA family methyltransferase
MTLALYDPEHGFYTKGPGIGTHTGMFNTNAMFPAFAFALARAIQHAEDLVGESLRIVEFGGGTAELASNVRSFLSTPHEYVIVDISPGCRAQQTRRGFQAMDSVDSLHPAPTFAFGNEVLDALPVHRVMGNGLGELLEFFVAIDGKGEFIEQPDIPSTPLLAERLRSEGIILGRGQTAEICLDLEGVIEKMAHPLSKGYLMFIDYGEEASFLYSHSRRNGTLRSFRSQQAVFNPFESVGDQDITADVDFTALKRAAKKAGLHSTGCLQQGIWLKNLGIHDYQMVVEDNRLADEEISFLTSPARLGSTFDVALFKTEGIPDGPGLHLC